MAYSFNTPFGTLRSGSWAGGWLPEFGLTERLPQSWQNNVGSPLPQPQPQQDRTSSTTTGGNQNTNNNNWSNPYNTPTTTSGNTTTTTNSSTNNNPGGSEMPNLDSQLNAMYDPVFQSFNNTESYLRDSFLPTRLSGIDAELQNNLGQLDTQTSESKREVDRLQDMAGKQFQTAQDLAVRQHNVLQQNAHSRYGMGASTGRAVSELANQEFLRGNNQLSLAFQSEGQKLSDRLIYLDQYGAQQKRAFQAKADQQRKEANDLYVQQMVEISRNRSMAEADKAAKRMETVQNYLNLQMQIDGQMKLENQKFDQWKQQWQMATANEWKQLQSQFQPYQNIEPAQNQYFSSPGQQPNYQASLPTLPNLRALRRVDEFGRLVQEDELPFLS